jgi:AcrR family transcriptional regulator
MTALRPRRSPTRPVRRYHHGNLRAALLAAAEAELEAHGIEGFSLRGVAKRAGVSHAAPAHHFGEVNGLLTALAAEGYRRFMQMQDLRLKKAAPDGLSRLVASGMGYIDFATAHPALFRLMFSSDRPDREHADLNAAASMAFQRLVEDVRGLQQGVPLQEKAEMQGVMAAWGIVHGLADLMTSGRLKYLMEMRPREREACLQQMLRRMFECLASGAD